MKRVTKSIVGIGLAVTVGVVGAAPANAEYTRGNPVELRLSWYGAQCATVVFPKATQRVCGGGSSSRAEYRVNQGTAQPGRTFGANVLISGPIDAAYCELRDGRTGDIIENDFSEYGRAQCLTDFT